MAGDEGALTDAAGLGLRADDRWEKLPDGIDHRDVTAVAVGPDQQVHLFTRHPGMVLVFDIDGHFLRSFGEGSFAMPHGLVVDADGCVYCVDNRDQTVRKFSPTGELLQTFGTPNSPSDTGFRRGVPVEVHSVETVARPGPPFNGCTDVAIADNGDVFVSDGYGNCRIHHFDAAGELLNSWGEVGSGPGQFRLPHALVLTADQRLLVADRENDRIQIFDRDGSYRGEWGGLQRPTDLAVAADGTVYVAELWRPLGTTGFAADDRQRDQPSRLTVLSPDGRPIARWGSSTTAKNAPGNFVAPHSIALDAEGSLYVAEVTYSFAISAGRVGDDHAAHQFQKFHSRTSVGNNDQETP